MAKEGVLPTVTDMFGPAGNAQLDEMELGDAYTIRVRVAAGADRGLRP